jgi:iron complex transport system substrate-binding protein
MKTRWIIAALLAGAFLPLIGWGIFLRQGERQDSQIPKPKRIVSLCVPATEIICQLGASQKLVALCDGPCPDEVKGLPRVGKAFWSFSVEAIIGAKPDLVFCWRAASDELSRRGIRTFMVETRSLEGVIALVGEIGREIAQSEAADKLIAEMRGRVTAIKAKLANTSGTPLVYFESGSIGKTRGLGTLTHDLIGLAGGRNIAGNEPVPYPLLSAEHIIEQNPDVIIVEEYGQPVGDVGKRDGWRNLKAVRDGRIYQAAVSYTNYTPRCVEGLEKFAEWFHPEAFHK